MNRLNLQKFCKLALITALALIIFTVEMQIPNPIPIPGVKLGLANIITLFCIFCYGPKDALYVLLARIILGSMFSPNPVSLLYSLSGGLFCYCITVFTSRVFSEKYIWLCSIIGAIFHNIGQIIIAIWLLGTWQIVYYLPYLMISAVASGLFTGASSQYVIRRMKKSGVKW